MRTSLPPRALTLPSHRGKRGTNAGASQTSATGVRAVYSQGTPVRRIYWREAPLTRMCGSLMKTHNWPRPRARLFAVNKVSLFKLAARRACSFPPRCKFLQLRRAANPRITQPPSRQICWCCSSIRSRVASSEDPYHGCRDCYLRWGTTPLPSMQPLETTAAPTRPPCTEVDLSVQGRI